MRHHTTNPEQRAFYIAVHEARNEPDPSRFFERVETVFSSAVRELREKELFERRSFYLIFERL